MKKTSPVFLILLLISTHFFSCKLEPCKDYPCFNGEALQDGSNCFCLCRLGWSGFDCGLEDKCVTGNVRCQNGGFCNSGSGLCSCVTGYEGDTCEILSRDKFLNNGANVFWNANDTCGLFLFQYVAEIRPATDKRVVEIYNIRDLSLSQFISCEVNKLRFEQKGQFVTIGAIDVSTLKGDINEDFTAVRVTYAYNDGLLRNCTGSWVRQ